MIRRTSNSVSLGIRSRAIRPAAVSGSYVWSPTGTQILFVAQHWIGDSLTLPDIFVVPADGSAPPVNLTNAPSEWHFQPQWSPDGTRIAFTTGFGIAVMNADASNAIQLTGGSDTSDSHPSWSPAGDRIAFQRLEGREQDGHIYVMNADGTGAVQLTNDSAFVDRSPLWSANGKSITFVRGAFGLSSSIFVMKLSDGTLTNISGTLPVDGPGVWSPDGRRVAFGSVNFFGAPGDIFAVNRHGSNLSNLTGTPTIFEFGPPSWSPNSKRIAFYVRDPEDWRRGDIFSIAVK